MADGVEILITEKILTCFAFSSHYKLVTHISKQLLSEILKNLDLIGTRSAD
jgi:hypothetical protein